MEYKLYNFERLEVYALAEELIIKIYAVLKKFPKEEIYGLSSQIKRSVVSVALNIAEGSAERSTKDFTRFITIAIGSLVETKSALMISVKLKFLSENELKELIPDFDKLFFKLLAFKKSLNEKSQ